MLDSFLYSLNSIAPIFILVILGAFLKKKRLIDTSFVSICDKLVFKICLPCLLFCDIVSSDLKSSLDISLIGFCVAVVTMSFALPCILVPLFIKDNAKRGAFIQGMYRSNAAILGTTLAKSMFDEAGGATLAMALPFVVVLFNVFAVVVLSMYAPSDVKLTGKLLVNRILKTVVTNPLIIAIVLALVWKLTGLMLPKLAVRSLTYMADMSMPLALISLGANFTVEALRGRAGLAIIASVFKTVLVPLFAVGTAVACGFRGVPLGIVFILFGGPTAVSSYIMAKQMKSDYELASQILLLSTFMSLFTLFAGILLLKAMALI